MYLWMGLSTRNGFGVFSRKTERLGIKICVNVMLFLDDRVGYISLLFIFFVYLHVSVEFMCSNFAMIKDFFILYTHKWEYIYIYIKLKNV